MKILEVPTRTNLDNILSYYHDTSPHPGINNTVNKIRTKYIWKGISNDVRQYVSQTRFTLSLCSVDTVVFMLFSSS